MTTPAKTRLEEIEIIWKSGQGTDMYQRHVGLLLETATAARALQQRLDDHFGLCKSADWREQALLRNALAKLTRPATTGGASEH